ncbi:hypothetical protein Tco_1088951 [Tanacetum coccineum]
MWNNLSLRSQNPLQLHRLLFLLLYINHLLSPFVDTPPATPPHSPKASSHPDATPDTSVDPLVAPTPFDRQDLSKLYGMSTTGGSSVEVWNDQHEWVIHSWKLFPFSGVHALETFTGKILYMFADTLYPLSASLIKKMLKHKLEVEIDCTGNDMT